MSRRTTRASAQASANPTTNSSRHQPSKRGRRTRNHPDPSPTHGAGDDSQLQDYRPPTPLATQRSNTSPAVTQLEPDKIDVHNYHTQKAFWPLPRIEERLALQSCKNNSQPSPLILAEAKALYGAFIHNISMLAMVGDIGLDTLKAKLGLKGGSCETSTWDQFLAFAKAANQLPMPTQGDPNASAILTARNQANKEAYDRLSEDELMLFTPRVFFALGGYPDYSQISVDDYQDCSDSEVLIPEVPKLTEDEEALYRPLYQKIINLEKVSQDREKNKTHSTSHMEQRSLQAFKKRAQQLNQDANLTNFDFYVIASSKTLGPGWCEEVTTRPEISKWLNQRHNFQTIFPVYSQVKLNLIEDVDNAAAEVDGQGEGQKKRRTNKCDLEKTKLTEQLSKNLTRLLGSLPSNGIPRGPDPPALFGKFNVQFVRSDNSALPEEQFMLGFDGMLTLGRRRWLQDLEDGNCTMVLKVPPIVPGQTEAHGQDN
ncbi:hypothetical protein DFH28DRAFT_1049940 [Melampsora americana]|nr:hypothetical protein DFH28DRAFT_1049940 [Melampsora americana]